MYTTGVSVALKRRSERTKRQGQWLALRASDSWSQSPDRRIPRPLLLRHAVDGLVRRVSRRHLPEAGHVHVDLFRVSLEADIEDL